jgi:hypothetical protein
MLEGLMLEFPEVWRRYPELATMRRAELKSVLVATVTGGFRAARLSDALRNLTDYAGYRVSRRRPSLYDSLQPWLRRRSVEWWCDGPEAAGLEIGCSREPEPLTITQLVTAPAFALRTAGRTGLIIAVAVAVNLIVGCQYGSREWSLPCHRGPPFAYGESI